MRRARLATAILAAATLAGSARAHAGEPEVEARAQSSRGLSLYELGEYSQAIAAFKASYALAPAPVLLYDLAQAYRRLGDCGQALAFYRLYLQKNPEAPKRARVAERIDEMARCAETHVPSPETPRALDEVESLPPLLPPSRPLPPSLSLAPPIGRAAPGRALRIAGGVAAGVSAALLAGAAVATAGAYDAADGTSRLFRDGGVYTPEARDLDALGRRDQAAAAALYACAAAAAVASVVCFVVDHRARARSRRGALAQGSEAAWSGSF